MKNESNAVKQLTSQEIRDAITTVKKPGFRFTVDLYLLDYIKHCFLEGDQLNNNIKKLHAALSYLSDKEIKKGVEDVIKSLQCVQDEYKEYVEDVRVLVEGGYPDPRGETSTVK